MTERDEMAERFEMALRFVRLGEEAGGQLILSHPASRAMRQAFLDAQANGWLDGDGWVTYAGRLQLEETT
jgi:hypothetical protein